MFKRVSALIVITGLFLGQFMASAEESSKTVKVACVGDSITFGFGIKDRETNSYPAQLAAKLGKGYEVKNFGVNAATLLKKGNKPYLKLGAFKEAQDFQPNIVIIKLGTNDTKPDNWKFKDEFEANYVEMVKIFQGLKSKPEVWICYPVPVFEVKWGINDQTVKEGVIPLVDAVAKKTGVKVINLYKPLEGKSKLLPDKIHPNTEGAKIIADTVFAAITDKKSKK